MKNECVLNRDKWENFAKENAIFYIDMKAKNISDFWKRGELNYEKYILPILDKYSVSNSLCLDFGCGFGRQTFPLGRYFKSVIGVDLSKHMIERARKIAHQRKTTKIKFIENSDFFNITDISTFIYCVNVFQHIENMSFIRDVLEQMFSLLNGYAYVHFDTRKRNWFHRLRDILPDFLLPKSQRRGIRRICRNAKTVESLINKIGFTIIEQKQPNSEYHIFLLRNIQKQKYI